MKKSKIFVKRVNAFISAFVFFIGVFSFSCDRVQASAPDYPIDTHALYLSGDLLFHTNGTTTTYRTVDKTVYPISSSSGLYFDREESSSGDSAIYSNGYYAVDLPVRLDTYSGPMFVDGFIRFALSLDFYLSNGVKINPSNIKYTLDSPNSSSSLVWFFNGSFVSYFSGFPASYNSLVGTLHVEFWYSQAGQSAVPINLKFSAKASPDSFHDINGYKVNPYDSTQIIIDNQTEDLTNGFNDSSGNTASDALGSGIADYDQAEGNLFTSASTSMEDFKFTPLDSVPAVTTSISFVSSLMAMIFDQSGGLTGAGIVMSVSLCALIGSIVVGVYRYWHKDD